MTWYFCVSPILIRKNCSKWKELWVILCSIHFFQINAIFFLASLCNLSSIGVPYFCIVINYQYINVDWHDDCRRQNYMIVLCYKTLIRLETLHLKKIVTSKIQFYMILDIVRWNISHDMKDIVSALLYIYHYDKTLTHVLRRN